MDQIKTLADLSLDDTNEQQDTKANEVRTLNDLELVLAGGGDGMVNW
jgi:diacylglycerol kinase family enzyme